MAKKIKVKVVVTLDAIDSYVYEIEESFNSHMHGHDLSEAVIKVASTAISDVVREIVENSHSSA